MDSLLASYASSSDDEEAPLQQQINSRDQGQQGFLSENASKSSKFSLPPPKSSKFSLPPPKSSSFSLAPPKYHSPDPQKHKERSENESNIVKNRDNQDSSSLFASLPQPKASASPFLSLPPPKTTTTNPQPRQNPGTSQKRVVQFRPPLNPYLSKYSNIDDEDDDEDAQEREKRRKRAESSMQAPSVQSFLSSIPAPKHSSMLGGFSSGSGTGRRSIVDTEVPASVNPVSEISVSEKTNEAHYVAPTSSSDHGGYGYESVDHSYQNSTNGDYPSYTNDSKNYQHFENNWGDGSNSVAPESIVERELRMPSKRGRKDVVPQIIEVSQDELMKNRPREDQAKMTGIAFGPAFEPGTTKNKPNKLHKRKHQIGTLYQDMKHKEAELADRRARGYQTKAQTQGKYGW